MKDEQKETPEVKNSAAHQELNTFKFTHFECGHMKNK